MVMGLTFSAIPPCPHLLPQVCHGHELLGRQARQDRLATTLFVQRRRISIAVEVMPVGQDHVGALLDISHYGPELEGLSVWSAPNISIPGTHTQSYITFNSMVECIVAGVRNFSQQNEAADENAQPAVISSPVDQLHQGLDDEFEEWLEHAGNVDAVELVNDHARNPDFASQVCRAVGLFERGHLEVLVAANPRATRGLACYQVRAGCSQSVVIRTTHASRTTA